MSHFGLNHVLGNLTALNMNVQSLQHLQSLQHGDVLEKLKMQVRDINVGLMEKEFPMHSPFGNNTLPTTTNTSFTLPQLNSSQPQNLTANTNGFPFTPPNAPCLKDGKFLIFDFY